MIDSWLGVAVGVGAFEASEDDAEVTSGVLWLHRASDGEAVALEEHHIVVIRLSLHEAHSDVWPKQDVCRQRRREAGDVTYCQFINKLHKCRIAQASLSLPNTTSRSLDFTRFVNSDLIQL